MPTGSAASGLWTIIDLFCVRQRRPTQSLRVVMWCSVAEIRLYYDSGLGQPDVILYSVGPSTFNMLSTCSLTRSFLHGLGSVGFLILLPGGTSLYVFKSVRLGSVYFKSSPDVLLCTRRRLPCLLQDGTSLYVPSRCGLDPVDYNSSYGRHLYVRVRRLGFVGFKSSSRRFFGPRRLQVFLRAVLVCTRPAVGLRRLQVFFQAVLICTRPAVGLHRIPCLLPDHTSLFVPSRCGLGFAGMKSPSRRYLYVHVLAGAISQFLLAPRYT